MHLVMIGGSDAGISAALRARELDPGTEVSVIVADAYPNFSICVIPYYVSGEVTHWRNLAHRTTADLEATGMNLRLDTTARRIDVGGRKLLVTTPAGLEGRHVRRHAHAGGIRASHRGHRRRRVHRPGNGRRAHHPRPARHPDGTAPRGSADR